MDYAYKVTTHGRAAIAAYMALETPFRITRVAFGSGRVEEETNLADVHQLLEYVSDGAAAGKRHQDDRFELTIQYANSEHREVPTFLLSEFIVYVENPATGEETDLLYGTLGDYRQPVPAYNPAYPPSVFNFPLTLILSDEISVVVSTPTGLVTWDDLSNALGDINPASGSGIPTSSTAGIVGQKYVNTDSGAIYTCIAAELPEGAEEMQYIWVPGSLGTLEEIRAALSNKADLSLISNPNLLDNWYFIGGGSQQGEGQFPINQRGETEYTTGYGLDRWSCSAPVALMSDCIAVYFPGGGSRFFVQNIEYSKLQRLSGQTITISVLYKSSVAAHLYSNAFYDDPVSSIYNVSEGMPISNELALASLTLTIPSVDNSKSLSYCTLLGILSTESGNVKVYAAKAELGPRQTLAHKEGDTWILNDPPPNYALELETCQRYYKRVHATGIWHPISWTEGICDPYIYPEVNYGMRITPVPKVIGSAACYGPTGWNGDASIISQTNGQVINFSISGLAEQTSDYVGTYSVPIELIADL